MLPYERQYRSNLISQLARGQSAAAVLQVMIQGVDGTYRQTEGRLADAVLFIEELAESTLLLLLRV